MKNLLTVTVALCCAAISSYGKPASAQESGGIYAQSKGSYYFTIRILPSNGQAMETRDGGASWRPLSTEKAESIKAECAQMENAQPFLSAETVSSVTKGYAPANQSASESYSDPAGGSSTIAYRLADEGNVVISVYAETGARVAEIPQGMIPVGNHSVSVNMSGMPSGMYFYRIVKNGAQISMGKIFNYR